MYNHRGWCFPDEDTHFLTAVNYYPETTYQQKTLDIAYEYVNNFDVALDVGANIGLHTVRFSNRFNKVYAFEPVKSNFQCLTENTKTLSNITLYNNGIGDTITKLDIKAPVSNKNCGAYSFVDFESYGDLVTSETISVITIDSLDLAPNLIKIDTQGFEKNVITGAINTIKNYSPVVIAELESKVELQLFESIMRSVDYKLATRHRKDYIWIKPSV